MEDIFTQAGIGDSGSYQIHESICARLERSNKRMWIACIILIASLIISNAGWVYYESQFVETETTVEQEVDTGEGDATVIGVGDYNGEGETDGNNEITE